MSRDSVVSLLSQYLTSLFFHIFEMITDPLVSTMNQAYINVVGYARDAQLS